MLQHIGRKGGLFLNPPVLVLMLSLTSNCNQAQQRDPLHILQKRPGGRDVADPIDRIEGVAAGGRETVAAVPGEMLASGVASCIPPTFGHHF